MTTAQPTAAPLAALLASHPEECAAVVAALAIADPCDGRSTSGIVEDVALYFPALPRLDVGEVGVICDACCAAGFAELDRWGDYAVVEGADRYAIARMGAAAWLRARLPRSDSHRFFDLSNARLHEIAADAMRSAVDEDARKNAYLVRAQADSAVPQSASEYRRVLDSIVARGWPIDVEAEVAAVWGRETETGAQAPKGEQR